MEPNHKFFPDQLSTDKEAIEIHKILQLVMTGMKSKYTESTKTFLVMLAHVKINWLISLWAPVIRTNEGQNMVNPLTKINKIQVKIMFFSC